MQDEPLFVSTVFKGLSKPATLMGVNYDYFLIEGMFIMLVFIFSGSFSAFLFILPLHALGWVLHQMDPHIFKLISVRATIGATKNKRIWGCQSYAPF